MEREKNRLAICRFLYDSCEKAREQLQTGYRLIRDELADLQARGGKMVSRILSPVRSFLKDPSDMQQEMESCVEPTQSYWVYLDGKWIPGHDLLQGPMEENY